MQFLAFALSFGLIAVTLSLSGDVATFSPWWWWISLFGGLVSGFFATVARDLLASLQGLRGRN